MSAFCDFGDNDPLRFQCISFYFLTQANFSCLDVLHKENHSLSVYPNMIKFYAADFFIFFFICFIESTRS